MTTGTTKGAGSSDPAPKVELSAAARLRAQRVLERAARRLLDEQLERESAERGS